MRQSNQIVSMISIEEARVAANHSEPRESNSSICPAPPAAESNN